MNLPDVDAPAVVSYGRRLTAEALAHPASIALVCLMADGSDVTVSWGELERDANRIAHLLSSRGAAADTIVMVSLPSGPDHVKSVFGAWKLGACVLPYNSKAPRPEREEILGVATTYRRVITVGDWTDGAPPMVAASELIDLAGWSDEPPPDVIPSPARAIASGGTTGRPKLTISNDKGAIEVRDGTPVMPAGLHQLGLRLGHVQLVCTPLYHTSGSGWTKDGLSLGNRVVVMERFDARRSLEAIEKYQVNYSLVVPAVMLRWLDVPDLTSERLSSVQMLGHGGAPCPEWVKRRWLELLGPDRLIEGYGATEAIGMTTITGREWLEHPGSAGRPYDSELRILDEADRALPNGEVGEIFMRPIGATAPAFHYVGADYHRVTDDGFVSLGDFGWTDGDGYLYFADRRVDMIVSGGANVYPAEVEAAVGSHPQVADAAVIGLADARWGRRVHAVIQVHEGDPTPTHDDIDQHCRARLAPYKVPKTYEFVASGLRTEVGKLARARLLAEREAVP
ncbi:MAG: AMP-binding protein [Candidatus Dormibacteria bacterium]